MWDNRARDDDARGPPQRHRRAAGGAGRGARKAHRGSGQGGPGRGGTGGGKAKASDDQAVNVHQQLQIAKLTRQLYGQRSERTLRLLDQMELALEELESSTTEDEIAAERAVAKTTNVVAFTRKRPARQPLPEHLLRERVVEPGPTVCL